MVRRLSILFMLYMHLYGCSQVGSYTSIDETEFLQRHLHPVHSMVWVGALVFKVMQSLYLKNSSSDESVRHQDKSTRIVQNFLGRKILIENYSNRQSIPSASRCFPD